MIVMFTDVRYTKIWLWLYSYECFCLPASLHRDVTYVYVSGAKSVRLVDATSGYR